MNVFVSQLYALLLVLFCFVFSVPSTFLLVWLFCPISISLLLFYLILLYYYSLNACLFSKERQNGYGSRWEGKWKGTGRNRG